VGWRSRDVWGSAAARILMGGVRGRFVASRRAKRTWADAAAMLGVAWGLERWKGWQLCVCVRVSHRHTWMVQLEGRLCVHTCAYILQAPYTLRALHALDDAERRTPGWRREPVGHERGGAQLPLCHAPWRQQGVPRGEGLLERAGPCCGGIWACE